MHFRKGGYALRNKHPRRRGDATLLPRFFLHSSALPSLDLDGDCKPEVYGSYQTIRQMGAGKSVTNSTDRLDRLEAIIESNSRAIRHA